MPKDSFRLTRNVMRNLTQCACGAFQNPQPKLMVFKSMKKTNIESDEFDYRLPARVIINKSDIAYITTRTSLSREFVSVVMDDGTEYFSDHPLKNFLVFMSDAIQINKQTLIPLDKITASNEWQFAYAGVTEEPFEISDIYRDAVREAVTAICTLPKKHEKRL